MAEDIENVNFRKYLDEGKEYIRLSEPVQASAKLYKASEEAVKSLAKSLDLPEDKEAEKKGRWTAPFLFSAVRNLSEKVEPEVIDWWDHAWFLHVEGFHEARLNIEEIKFRLRFIEEIVNLSDRQKGCRSKG